MEEKNQWRMEQLHQLREFGTKLMLFDKDVTFLIDVDEDFCNMLGCTKEELMVRCRGEMRELVETEDCSSLYSSIREQLAQTGTYTCRYRMKKFGGSIWVWESGTRVEENDGKMYVYATVMNMSNEEMTRLERDMTYENIPGGAMTVLVTDHNFHIIEASNQYFDMVGAKREEYLGSSGIYTFKQDLPGLRSHIIQRAKSHKPIDYEFRTRHPADSSIRWYRMVGRFYQQTSEGCEYMCVLLDINKRRQNMYQLEKEKERYRIAMGITANILFEYDVEKKKLQLYSNSGNDSFRLCLKEKTYGSWESIMEDSGLVLPEDIPKLRSFQEGQSSTAAQLHLLTENRKTGEKSFQCYDYVAKKIYEQGRLSRIIGSVKNIEEQRKKQQQDQDLTQIFQVQTKKIYELVIMIHISSGKVQGYFTHGISYERIYNSDTFDDYVQKTAEQFVHPDERGQFYEVFQMDNMIDVLNNSVTEEVLFFRLRKEGDEYRYKCFRYSYLGNDTDTIILTTQDVHEMRKQQVKLEKADRKVMESAIHEAKETVEVRRSFIAMLVREIQSPIRYINTMLRKTEDNKSDVKLQMKCASQYALNSLKAMVEYEKIDQGKVRLEHSDFSIDEIIDMITQEWVANAKEKDIQLECFFNFAYKDYYGDVEKFKEMIEHILGNCIRNSESGSKISLWMSDEYDKTGISQISIAVEDYGIPIGDGYFGRQYPLEEEENYAEKPFGTSFSLILARRIAELMGGHMRMRRQREATNVIEVSIPIQCHSHNTRLDVQKDEEKREEEKVLKGYKILLVEDNRENSMNMIAPILKVNGAVVDVAYSGKEGLDLWNSYSDGTFDAIIVEGYLSDMDYVTFASRLANQSSGDMGKPMLLVLVDDLHQENVAEAIEAGVNSVLEKPLKIEKVKQILEFSCETVN